jgi:hypothetical protein
LAASLVSSSWQSNCQHRRRPAWHLFGLAIHTSRCTCRTQCHTADFPHTHTQHKKHHMFSHSNVHTQINITNRQQRVRTSTGNIPR